MSYANGMACREKAPPDVILTFDDGYEDFYKEAFPRAGTFRPGRDGLCGSRPNRAVQHLGSRRSDFVASAVLTVQQIRELHRHGVTFGSHSLTRTRFYPYFPLRDLRREVSDSKSRLEDLLGFEVERLCLSQRPVDCRVRAAVADAGYKIAMSLGKVRTLGKTHSG